MTTNSNKNSTIKNIDSSNVVDNNKLIDYIENNVTRIISNFNFFIPYIFDHLTISNVIRSA